MKIGINMLLWGTTITEEHVPVMEWLKELGYDGVEFPVFAFDNANYKKIRKHLDRLGLGCTIVTCVPPDANPISADANVRKAGLQHIKKAIDTAVILGSPLVCGPFYAPLGVIGRPRTDGEWEAGVATLKKAAEYAEKKKIDLVIEPLNRFETYFINTLSDAVKMAREVKSRRVKVMYDTFHGNIEEQDVAEALQKSKSKIGHIHISENDRGIPGDGHIDFKPTFKLLKDKNYKGWVTSEAFGDAFPEIAAATCIWRPLYKSREELAEKGLKFIQKNVK